jgi:hypothetical protein
MFGVIYTHLLYVLKKDEGDFVFGGHLRRWSAFTPGNSQYTTINHLNQFTASTFVSLGMNLEKTIEIS